MSQSLTADQTPQSPSAPEPTDVSQTKTVKKTKAERSAKPPKPAGERLKQDTHIRKKRGPARPHRRLDIETITSRIEKLDKRRLRAKEQLEDATRHVEGYQAERNFREQEAAATSKESTEK